MSLINCPECGKQVSDETHVCVHCGFPLKEKPVVKKPFCNKIIFRIIVLLCLLIIFLFCLTFPIALAEEKTVRVETDAKLEYNKGIDFYNSGQFDKAVDCFRAAIDLEPEYIDAYYNLGMTLDYLKQYHQHNYHNYTFQK